jgi:hypothetical protein
MSSQREPWEYHGDLSRDRLTAIGQLFHDVRAEVADVHLPESGDDNYVLGTRGWTWCKNRLIDVVRSGAWPWLAIVDPQRPTFTIGTVAVGFYRGEPDRPNSRTLRQSNLELMQQTLAFGEEASRVLTWRFATPLDFDGKPSEVAFVGFNEGGQREVYYPIPVETRPPTLRVVDRALEPPTAVPSAAVRIRQPGELSGTAEDTK